MEHRISATELARNLGDALGRIRYRNDSFLIERNGEPVARLVPVEGASAATVREALVAWGAADPADPGFTDDLDAVSAADTPPENPWAL